MELGGQGSRQHKGFRRITMARGDQLGRQWKIIQTLVSARQGKSAAELAQELDCHPRTLYRDLEALQVAGFPIYTEKVDGKALWSLLDTVKHQIPLPFSLTELMALYFGRDMRKVFRGTVFYDSLESLFTKIKTTLPPESIKYLENVEQTLHLGMKPYKDYGKFKEILKHVNDAAVNRKAVEIIYFTMSRRKESRRKVNPYRIWFFNGTFYLIGLCHMRGDVRLFALDRIKMLHSDKGDLRGARGLRPGSFHRGELRGISGGACPHKGMVSSGCGRLHQGKDLA